MKKLPIDISTFIGIVIAFGAIIGGQVMEGGRVGTLMQLTAFIIVIGGTLGAVMIQYSLPSFLLGMKLVRWAFVPPQLDLDDVVKQIAAWSNSARRGGLLSLEPILLEMDDPFMKKGLQMLVDGTEPEKLREAMEVEIDAYDEHFRLAAKVWESAGGYSPTIGILGAVMGLIHVMENLSDPAKLGAGIAVAFVATIYGVGAANLFFLPFSNKIKTMIGREIIRRQMAVEGLVSIANGENPRQIEAKLRGFIA